jgi:hypothetical protein
MASIPYVFHWVQRSIDEKKQRQLELESHESIPTTSTELKPHSFSWFNQLFAPQINNQHEYPQFDFEFLHGIL